MYEKVKPSSSLGGGRPGTHYLRGVSEDGVNFSLSTFTIRDSSIGRTIAFPADKPFSRTSSCRTNCPTVVPASSASLCFTGGDFFEPKPLSVSRVDNLSFICLCFTQSLGCAHTSDLRFPDVDAPRTSRIFLIPITTRVSYKVFHSLFEPFIHIFHVGYGSGDK